MTSIVALGRLEKVPLREAWPHEAGNFTPWLAESGNLALLGDALGLNLELEAIEQAVDSFSADIVARELSTGSRVLIENQLEQTDHSHLGQILTYAAGLSASTVVWIAREFREPHRAAIDYLNAISNAEHNFFAVQLELYRIGTSALAPRFSLVAKPNDWSKSIVARAADQSANSALHQEWQTYWAGFFEHSRTGGRDYTTRVPPREGWCRLDQLQPASLATAVWAHRPRGKVRAVCWLQGVRHKEAFDALEIERAVIEQRFGGPLIWERMDGKKSSMVLAEAAIAEDGDPEAEYRWLRDATMRLTAAMQPSLLHVAMSALAAPTARNPTEPDIDA